MHFISELAFSLVVIGFASLCALSLAADGKSDWMFPDRNQRDGMILAVVAGIFFVLVCLLKDTLPHA